MEDEEENRRFAEALLDGCRAGSPPEGVMGVEHVLERVVAPLAAPRGRRVLLVVLDGASWPVVSELLADLARCGWTERVPESGPLPPVVSTFPSITETARTTLLSGVLSHGDAGDEKKAFRSHGALVSACNSGYPPVLFHRSDFERHAPGQIGPELTSRIENDRFKVVGVVVNAVDDHLARSDQVVASWQVDTSAPLSTLLGLARRAGRIAVLASDHGHVLEGGTGLRPAQGGGDRWQPGGRRRKARWCWGAPGSPCPA